MAKAFEQELVLFPQVCFWVIVIISSMRNSEEERGVWKLGLEEGGARLCFLDEEGDAYLYRGEEMNIKRRRGC